MKIIDVIERVDGLCPNPYTLKEKINWLNELGTELTANYIPAYKTVILKDDELLPIGVTADHIDSVILNGKFLSRDDIDYSRYTIYPTSERRAEFLKDALEEVRVTYRVPYDDIRFIRESAQVTLKDGGFMIPVMPNIVSGDILLIGNVTAYIDSAEILDEGLMLYTKDTVGGGLQEIERVITELTVTEPPYDGLYLEYLMAKIARFQKDYETENRALSNYNVMLSDFQNSLIKAGRGKSTKFYNYW